jgi:hypothetical protein
LDQGDPPPCSREEVAGKGVTRGVRKCGNHWTYRIFGAGKDGRLLEREARPREHERLSH